ncbi:nucleotidyltransferase family protein [Streptococcus lutetiensis]|uniref:Prolyl-tRNA synthetase n=1 Tax=Streptococcus lutetiensis TaxID=150055 RepID=A0AB38G460_9STRE|nr:nucleotidyltransferase family protein [Streptococcus lutetiensis]QQE30444.1 nucleotidyltransferase family protein [Streptococcus lutetiensis]SQF41634.1 prolyl-tRNA synthetase [Streptococcus lutetiensis]
MDLQALFVQDEELMMILRIIAELDLQDSWLAAGTLRNYVWNVLSGKAGLIQASDLDVVFYDVNVSYAETLVLQQDLQQRYPAYQWDIKNQVYMHSHSPNTLPYQNARDAVSKYPERCTAIAARLNNDELELFLLYGDDDIVNFVVQPTPHFLADKKRMQVYRERLAKKDWQEKWPNLQLLDK